LGLMFLFADDVPLVEDHLASDPYVQKGHLEALRIGNVAVDIVDDEGQQARRRPFFSARE
jgi:hypothetical protein